jgi:hypothetical protein
MAQSLYMIDFNGHKDTDFFVKNGKRFKKATDIGIKVFVDEGTIALKYKVGGKVYDTLFVKSDDGKSMVDASELDYVSDFYLFTKLVCKITGETVDVGFEKPNGERLDNGERFYFDRYIAEGNIRRSEYCLEDGEYDATVEDARIYLDIKLVMEEDGYKYKSDAEFFNEFDEDGKPVLSESDKVCPSDEQRKIGLDAIRTMLDTLKQNGLSLVIDRENKTLGIAKSHDYIYVDDEADGAIPSYIAFPSIKPEKTYFVSGCTTLKLNDN